MSSSVEVFMARQPIYGRNLELFAYELLFRQKGSTEAGCVDRGKAASALVSSLVDIGLNELAGATKAFINVSHELLMSPALSMLPKDKVVIELLETIEPTDEVLNRVKNLKKVGYTLALDDFRPSVANERLLDLVDIVKLDVLHLNDSQTIAAYEAAKRGSVRVLAERVETQEKHLFCAMIGYDLFQGYFFARPQLMRGHSLCANKLAMLRLAARMQAPNIQYAELEEIIQSDVALSYRLLKFVKSAYFGLPPVVTSIGQALMFLGVNTVSSMATLLAMAGTTNKPDVLFLTSLTRAKMCELLASMRHMSNRDRYFTVGMLSLLDALLDAPMDKILLELPLDAEMNRALTDPLDLSDLSQTLKSVVAFERGDWDTCSLDGLTPSDIAKAYHSAVCWSSFAKEAA